MKKHIQLITFVMFAGIAASQADLNSGLVGYYPFSGNANDFSGYGNHGTTNGVGAVPDRFGNPNSAYYFDGTSYVIVPSSPAIADLGEHATFAAWVKIEPGTVFEVYDYRHVFNKGASAIYYADYAIQLSKNSGFPPEGAPQLEYTDTNNVTHHANSGVTLTQGNWRHVAVTFDSGLIKFYQDGMLLNVSSNLNTAIRSSSRPLYIGRRYVEPGIVGFRGDIDEVRIYNRALSEVEVRALVARSLDEGLVAHYRLDGDANDSTIYGIHGTANGPTFVSGIFGTAAHFDGVNDDIVIPPHSSRSFSTNPFTVSLWFRTTEQDFGYMLDSRDYPPEKGYALITHLDSPGLNWSSQNDGQLYPGPSAAGGTNYQDGNWHLAVGTRDKYSISLFVDGVLVDTTTIPVNLDVSGPFPINLGKRYLELNAVERYTGDLDDIRIYNRSLSSHEIQQLFAAGSGRAFTSIGRAVRLDHQYLGAGLNYQLQVSYDLASWFNIGLPFTATSPEYSHYVDVGNWNAYFRLRTP